jgi:hypothetical protein
MASQVQNLMTVAANVKALLEQVRGETMTAEQRIKKAKVQTVGPIAGSHAAQEITAYLNGAEDHARQVRASLQAAVTRAEKLAAQIKGI